MKHMRRVVCPVCDGDGIVPDEEMSTGERVCSECMGHGTKDVDCEAPCCDVVSHEEIAPMEAR